MNSAEIQDYLWDWVNERIQYFNAPYGVARGEFRSKKGTKYRAVTFGRARTLDATVEIYNRSFIVLRTSRDGSETFKSVDELTLALERL